MGTVFLVNYASPPTDSPSARSYSYLGHVSYMVGCVDGIVNSLSILIMTSSWQPACLKKIASKIAATKGTAHKEEETEVSTLGGGSY